ncbi:uncharacterized protein G2W53_014756 [Senna tora]|uniref:Uncharacterized protein n=1 Tax=Senna tora TaxID=362788 RepID=A0A834WUN0_9FABA|nr:uncharacterized protein G2W53_014756 [Senna tora]
MENPKQSRARDFPHLPPNQTLHLPQRRRLLLLLFPEALLHFLLQDLLQRDDGAERYDATRRLRRDICLVAMDPPSMWVAKRVLGSMDIEKVKWMFALRASDWDSQDKNLWKILNRVEQEISLTYLQTKHFLLRGGGGFFSFPLVKHFCIFSGKICCNETTAPRVLMQQDDGAERSVQWPWILLRW